MSRLLFLLLFASISSGLAQIETYNLEQLTHNEGTNFGFVYDINQSQKNEITIACSDGVYKFNGDDWQQIPLGSEKQLTPTCVASSERGFAIGTFEGFRVIKNKSTTNIIEGSSPLFKVFAYEQSYLFINQQGDIFINDNSEPIIQLEADFVTSATIAGNTLNVSSEALSWRISLSSLKTVETIRTEMLLFPQNAKAPIQVNAHIPQGKKEHNVIDIGYRAAKSASIQSDRLFVATSDGLLKFYHSASGYLEAGIIKANNGLGTDDINVLFTDSDGYLWIGTNGEGLFKLNLNYQINLQLQSPVKRMLSLGNDILLITPNNILQYTSFGIDRISLDTLKYLDQDINGYARFNTAELFATENGFYVNEFGSINNVPIVSNEETIHTLNNVKIVNNTIWLFSRSSGIIIMNADYEVIDHISTVEGLPHNNIRDVHITLADTFLIHAGYGLIKMNRSSDSPFESVSQLTKYQITSLEPVISQNGRSVMMVGTDGKGVYVVDNDSVFALDAVYPELPKYVYDIQSAENQLWVLGMNKAVVISGTFESQHTYSFEVPNSVNGTLKILGRNEILIQTNSGLEKIVWSDTVITPSFSITLSQVKSDGKLLRGNLESEIPNGSHSFEFEMDVICPNYRNSVILEYRIQGYDNQWQVIDDLSAIRIPNVHPGDYTLEVRASFSNQHNVAKKTVLSVQISFQEVLYKRPWFIIASIVILMVIVYWISSYRHRQTKRRAIELERVVHKRTAEVRAQKAVIEEKNTDIMDSINYAQRIQYAILPHKEENWQIFKDSFILYMPKDVVAGDFYWLDTIDEYEFFAVADCTGHGVPGAFVSIICHGALNRSIYEFGLRNPADILDKTTDLVIDHFAKSGSTIKDGMDIALCVKKGDTIQYAGANRPLWLVRNGELIIKKPIKQPIGDYDLRVPFTNQGLKLMPGDRIFMFSDGYPDQFGGDNFKKFMLGRLKTILLESGHLPISEQGEHLKRVILDWKGDNMQIDDICMLGAEF